MLTTLVRAVSYFAVPAKFFLANFRGVIPRDDQTFEQFEILLRSVGRLLAAFVSGCPMAGRTRECPGHKQRDLVGNAQKTEILSKLLLTLGVSHRQGVGKLILKLVRLH